MKIQIIISFLFLTFSSTNLFSNDLLNSYSFEYQRKYNEALALTVKLGTENPKEYFYQLRAGWLSLLNGDFTKSIEYYRKAQVLEPNSIEPKIGILKAQIALGQAKQIETSCRTILRQDPKNYFARTNLAYYLYSQGNFKESTVVYAEILQDFPTDVEMGLGLGWSKLKEGEKSSARAVFQKVLVISPENARAKEGLEYAK